MPGIALWPYEHLVSAGVIVLLCSVFFKPAAGLNFQGKNLTQSQPSQPAAMQDPSELKVGLLAHHLLTACYVHQQARRAGKKTGIEQVQ